MTDSDCHSENMEPANDLVRGFLDGALDDLQLRTLTSQLRQDPESVKDLVLAAVRDESLAAHYRLEKEEAIRQYLLAYIETCGETCAAVSQRVYSPERHEDSKRKAYWRAAALIAASLLVATGLYVAWPREVAMITQVVDARYADGSAMHVGTRIVEGQRLEIDEGFVELTFDRGTVVAIKGPADFQVLNELRATSRRGRITVDVGERSTGFTVETPSANIVDWGTKFGVGVDGGETDIVVFDGIVDLHARGTAGDLKKARRLTQGEGLRVSQDGQLHRIMSVIDTEFPKPRFGSLVRSSTPVIDSVKDNIRDGATSKFYRIIYGGLNEDAQAYVDRSHQWNGLTAAGLPTFLIGADYVMPFNEDKRVHGLQVTVTLARDAIVYVMYDSRATTPKWLSSKFTDTGVQIGLDEGPSTTLRDWTTGVGPGESIDTHFRVWKCKAKAGESLKLGPRRDANVPIASGAMYGVAAVAADH